MLPGDDAKVSVVPEADAALVAKLFPAPVDRVWSANRKGLRFDISTEVKLIAIDPSHRCACVSSVRGMLIILYAYKTRLPADGSKLYVPGLAWLVGIVILLTSHGEVNFVPRHSDVHRFDRGRWIAYKMDERARV